MDNKLLKENSFNGVEGSPNAMKFLREVLVIDIDKRLGWKEISEHVLFQQKSTRLPANFMRDIDLVPVHESDFDMANNMQLKESNAVEIE